MCMQSITLNIFNLITNFIYIISNKYCMIVGAKYDSFIMNDAHTNYPANNVGPPTKVVHLIAFFSKKKMIFVQLLCRLLASQLGSQLMKCTLHYNI